MKPRLLFSLLFALLLLTGCARQRRFNAAERLFRQNAEFETLLLDSVLASYYRASPGQIGRLHDGYLRDGTFALLDSLDDAQQRLIAAMLENCSRRSVPRYADCIALHFRLVQRITDAEIPFIYKTFPPPWEIPASRPMRSR